MWEAFGGVMPETELYGERQRNGAIFDRPSLLCTAKRSGTPIDRNAK
jgi:hypothetical protein